jgi:hypothetical protein
MDRKTKPARKTFSNTPIVPKPETAQTSDWRSIRDDLLNASQERTEAEIAFLEADQTRIQAEQAQQSAAQRLMAAQKRHEQARNRAGLAS